MNRRQFAILLPSASTAAASILIGCDSEQKPSSAATLLHSSDVQDALKAMDSAIGNLEGDVGSFENENWRDVVPEVQGAASDVRASFDRLRRALGVSGA